MTASNPTSIAQNTTKPSPFTGCLVTGLSILFALLAIYELVWSMLVTYVFASAHLLSPFNIGIILLIVCECILYFLLTFRIRKQPWLVSLALLAVVWLVLPLSLRFTLNLSTTRVRNDGYSMESALPNQSYVLADRLAYRQKEPQRGDIIIFRFPLDPNVDLVKRVIGLPGETVTIQDGTVRVNDVPLEEPYITDPALYNGTWEIPEGQYFVLGDKRNDSRDSHQWGFLPRENIIAKAVWIYYPFQYFGKITDQ